MYVDLYTHTYTCIPQIECASGTLCVSLCVSMCLTMCMYVCVDLYTHTYTCIPQIECASGTLSMCQKRPTTVSKETYYSVPNEHLAHCPCVSMRLTMCMCMCMYHYLCAPLCVCVSMCMCLYVSLCVTLCVSMCHNMVCCRSNWLDRHPTKWKAELGVFEAQVCVCVCERESVYVSPMIATLPNGKLN